MNGVRTGVVKEEGNADEISHASPELTKQDLFDGMWWFPGS